MLRLPWCPAHRHLLRAEEGVDHGALPHIGVTDEANHTPAPTLGGLLREPPQEFLQQLSDVEHVRPFVAHRPMWHFWPVQGTLT